MTRDPAAAPRLNRPFAALRAALARCVAILLDRPPGQTWGPSPPRKPRRLPRVESLPDHLRRDIGFPPGSPFS